MFEDKEIEFKDLDYGRIQRLRKIGDLKEEGSIGKGKIRRRVLRGCRNDKRL